MAESEGRWRNYFFDGFFKFRWKGRLRFYFIDYGMLEGGGEDEEQESWREECNMGGGAKRGGTSDAYGCVRQWVVEYRPHYGPLKATDKHVP